MIQVLKSARPTAYDFSWQEQLIYPTHAEFDNDLIKPVNSSNLNNAFYWQIRVLNNRLEQFFGL